MRIVKGFFKGLFLVAVVMVTFIMNFIGAMICAITEQEGAMERKQDTPIRITRRKYEEKHKEERKAAHKVWGTSIDRSFANEIDSFLTKHNINKVELIYAGYHAMLKQYCPEVTENKQRGFSHNKKFNIA